MTEKLTYAKALELAEQVVTERGADFVYCRNGIGNCAYVPTTDPRYPRPTSAAAEGAGITGCAVGEVLKRADLLTDEVAMSFNGIAVLVANGFVPATSKAAVFLRQLQNRQDGGNTWGKALEAGKADASFYKED